MISALSFDVKKHGDFSPVVEHSVTEPAQSMTIRQIVDKFRKGQPVSVHSYDAYFDEGIEMPDMETLDLAERQEAVFEARARREEIEKDFKTKSQKRAAERKAKREEQDRLFEEWKKERAQGGQSSLPAK